MRNIDVFPALQNLIGRFHPSPSTLRRSCEPSSRLFSQNSITASAILCGALSTSLSQTRITCQPFASNSALTRLSRFLFASSFAIQYDALCPLLSLERRRFQNRPCQKSPSQKTATRALIKTTSGLPTTSVTFVRKRPPSRRISRLSRTSARYYDSDRIVSPANLRRRPETSS